jgi:general secretion pathway protein A
MVMNFYNLKEQPFGVTPDPRFLYMSPSHREALASLAYGIRSGRGFMSIIAEPGMGKTTTLFRLLGELKESATTVFLFQTLCSPEELLRALLRDLGVARVGASMVRMQEQLNRVLVAEARRGRKVVVVIDEAQNLEDSALELLRMLSNFETGSDKMMQIVLSGQPQLREKLASPQLLQLRQRMSIFARLSPFNAEETRLYIEHRLRVAGYNFQAPLFTPQADALIAQHSQGIPRTINNICFNALSLGCVLKRRSIPKEIIEEVLRDLELVPEGDGETQSKPGERVLFGWRAIQSSAVFQQAFAWRRRLAVLSLLLLPLVWLAGPGQSAKAGAPIPLPAVNVALQPPPAPTMTTDSQKAAQPHLRRSGNLRLRSQSEVAQTDDVATLWQQVKKHSSDAEVRLAGIYLEGTVVPRNCTQAQILLRDASQKGNARATNLLSDPAAQCVKSQ